MIAFGKLKEPFVVLILYESLYAVGFIAFPVKSKHIAFFQSTTLSTSSDALSKRTCRCIYSPRKNHEISRGFKSLNVCELTHIDQNSMNASVVFAGPEIPCGVNGNTVCG